MKNFLLFLSCFSALGIASAQPNCEYFRYIGDTLKYEACKKSMEIEGHYQFSRAFHEILDEAIAIDPTFDFAWREKSVSYLKSGDFLNWYRLMSKAVELNPQDHLGYRGWCRYQFFRDYAGAISDIERLDSLLDGDIGHSASGNYHLHIARAICYDALGDRKKAIQITESQLADPEHSVGAFDHLHLGIWYLEGGNLDKALENLTRQKEINSLAENEYYLALTNRELGDKEAYIGLLLSAKRMYLQSKVMMDPYTHIYDKVYLQQIEELIGQNTN